MSRKACARLSSALGIRNIFMIELHDMLFSIHLLNTFYMIIKLCHIRKFIEVRHRIQMKIGSGRSVILGTILSIFLSLITYYSAEYLYFEHYWRFISIFYICLGSFIIFVFLFNLIFKITPHNKYELTGNIIYLQRTKLVEQIFGKLLFRSILLISWLKTYPIIQVTITESQERIFSVFIFLLFLLSWATVSIRDRKRHKKVWNA